MMESSEEALPLFATKNIATIAGVKNIPNKLEAVALQIAAATFPFATDVNAMDDCTVDGSMHKNKIPKYKLGVINGARTGFSTNPNNGNSAKVLTNTVKCNRQCFAPANNVSRGNFAPCMKNSSPIASVVKSLKTWAARPEAGRKDAVNTVAINAKVKLSGKNRGRAMVHFLSNC